jgi:hypothetical protein
MHSRSLGLAYCLRVKDQSGIMRGHGNDVFFLRVPAGIGPFVRAPPSSFTDCTALMRLPCVGPRVPGRARCTASRVTLTDAAGMVPVRLPSAPSMAWDALATAVRHALRVERRTDSAPARVRRHRKQRLDACAPLIAAWLPSILTSTEGVTFGPILLMGRPLMTCSIVVGCIPALQASFSAGQIATPSFKCPVAVL